MAPTQNIKCARCGHLKPLKGSSGGGPNRTPRRCADCKPAERACVALGCIGVGIKRGRCQRHYIRHMKTIRSQTTGVTA